LKRRLGTRGFIALTVAAAGLGVWSTGASGASLYATPDATVHAAPCPDSNPCRLDTAMAAAANGDTVIVAPGDYYATGTTPYGPLPQVLAGRKLVGESKSDPPVIHSKLTANATAALDVVGTGKAEDLILKVADQAGNFYATGVIVSGGGGVNRLLVDVDTSGDTASACASLGGLFTNTVCSVRGTGPNSTALSSPVSGSNATTNVVNVTAISRSPNSLGVRVGTGTPNSNLMFLSNSIAQGETSDLRVTTNVSTPGGTATIDVDHSNWATQDTSGAGTEQIVDSGGNQAGMSAAEPLFRDAAQVDFREAPGSPTIDAGIELSVAGNFALGGQPRIGGTLTDIGAYEYYPAPTVTTADGSGLTQTSLNLKGTVAPNGSQAETWFEYGKTAAYGSRVDGPLISAAAPETPVSVPLTGLTPDTLYHYRLVAETPLGGLVAGADRMFKTLAVPKPSVRLTKLRVKKTWSLRKGTKIRFNLSRVARVTLKFERRTKSGKFKLKGEKVVAGKAGPNKVKVRKKLRGGKLKPGRYRLTAFAVTVDSTSSGPKRVRFRIKR